MSDADEKEVEQVLKIVNEMNNTEEIVNDLVKSFQGLFEAAVNKGVPVHIAFAVAKEHFRINGELMIDMAKSMTMHRINSPGTAGPTN